MQKIYPGTVTAKVEKVPSLVKEDVSISKKQMHPYIRTTMTSCGSMMTKIIWLKF